MKRSDLKELIKKSMLEVAPKSGATTLQEKDKVKLNLGLGAGDKYQYPNPTDYRDVPTDRMSPEELEHYQRMIGYSERGSDEMTPEEEYEERRRAELDTPSIVHGGITMREASIILDPEEVYNEYSPLFKQYTEKGMDRISAIKKAYSVLAQKHKTTPLIISQFLDSYWNDQYRNSTYANEDILREADEIVAAWAQKQTINEEINDGNEEMYGGYLELLEMNQDFEDGVTLIKDGISSVLTAWNEWKEGDETEPEMVEEAKHDVLTYLSMVIDEHLSSKMN